MRTRWRFGLNRRLVATIEWLLECPNAGAFPQTAQTFDMGWASIASAYAVAAGRRRVRRSAISRAESAVSEPLLPCGSPARSSARLRLSRGRTPKATGTPVSSPASWSPLAASPATYSKCGGSPRITQPSATVHAQRGGVARAPPGTHPPRPPDARAPARLRERHRAERKLERPRHGHDVDPLTGHARVG